MAVSTSYRQGNYSLNSPIPPDPTYASYTNKTRPVSAGNRRSPIPPDPVGTSRSDYGSVPRPRVKGGGALEIARSQQGKDLALLFNPAFRVIPLGVRPTRQEKRDYGQDNYDRIKQIQRANKDKQRDKSKQEPVKAVHTPGKYDHIQSKVAERLQTPAAPRPSTAPSHRTRSLSDVSKSTPEKPGRPSTAKSERRSSLSQDISDGKGRPPSPIQRQSSALVRRKNTDHIAENRRRVKSVTIKRAPSLSALDDLKKKKDKELDEYKRGQVPSYLKNRQSRWKKEEEERIANMPDPTIPTGHSLMPEAERLKTLEVLKKSQREMTSELQSLPLSRDTLRVKTRRDELEKKLQEVETALKIFSRQRVFIKDD